MGAVVHFGDACCQERERDRRRKIIAVCWNSQSECSAGGGCRKGASGAIAPRSRFVFCKLHAAFLRDLHREGDICRLHIFRPPPPRVAHGDLGGALIYVTFLPATSRSRQHQSQHRHLRQCLAVARLARRSGPDCGHQQRQSRRDLLMQYFCAK